MSDTSAETTYRTTPGLRRELIEALDTTTGAGDATVRRGPGVRVLVSVAAVLVAGGVAVGIGALLRPSPHGQSAGHSEPAAAASRKAAAAGGTRAASARPSPGTTTIVRQVPGPGGGTQVVVETVPAAPAKAPRSAAKSKATGSKAASAGSAAAPKKAAATQAAVTLVSRHEIVGRASGLCIDPAGSGSGAQLFLRSCSGSSPQDWSFYSDGTIRSQGLCMDANNGSHVVGALVAIKSCTGNGGQRFKINSANDLTTLSTTGMYICVEAQGTTAGSRLALGYCQGTSSQKWTPK